MNSGDKTVDALEIDVKRLEHQHKNDECACKLLNSALDDAKAEIERLTRELAEARKVPDDKLRNMLASIRAVVPLETWFAPDKIALIDSMLPAPEKERE